MEHMLWDKLTSTLTTLAVKFFVFGIIFAEKLSKGDFYLSNVHKWLLGSIGSAFLYIAPKYQTMMHPTVISNFYSPEGNNFEGEFAFLGTKDYSSMISAREAIYFRLNLTDQAVWEYNNGLCDQVEDLFTSRWNTTLPQPKNMTASMTNVQIPCNPGFPGCYNWTINAVVNSLVAQNVWTVVFERDSLRYLRISCQIYNYFQEYQQFASILESIIGITPLN